MSDISVVMCTYNGEAFVEEQLHTILGQTLEPAEIVVFDDQSSDRTIQIVQQVAATSGIPIRLTINERRLGFADNFLAACQAATADYIAFSDQDDRWKPHKLERTRAAIDDYDALLCAHSVEPIDATGTVLEEKPAKPQGARLLRAATPLGNFYGFTMLFPRSLLARIPAEERGLDPHTREAPLSHDRWIYFLATTFGQAVFLEEPLAEYRQHDSQLYGHEEARGLRERITTRARSGEEQSRYLASFAAHRASLLANPPAGEDAAVWRTKQSEWQRVERNYLRRADFYRSANFASRTRSLMGNASRSTYRQVSSGGLGAKGFVEDLVVLLATPFSNE